MEKNTGQALHALQAENRLRIKVFLRECTAVQMVRVRFRSRSVQMRTLHYRKSLWEIACTLCS